MATDDARSSGIAARSLALDVLLPTEHGDAYADALLGRELDNCALAQDDRHLATLLVYGTLARRLTLDHTIEAYCDRPLQKVEPAVLTTLRLGLFQIAFLDRVPDYAVVDTTVRLAKERTPHAAGFINAVLRRTLREGMAKIDEGAEPARRLAVEHSHPQWLVERWMEELGEAEAAQLMEADNQAAPTVLRALQERDAVIERLRADGTAADPTEYSPDGIRAAHAVTLPGVVVPQGEASQLVTLMLGARPGERVLDACAAPGGKTAHLARLVGSAGSVVAVDPTKSAPKRIRALTSVCAVDNVEIVNTPIAELEAGAEGFDAVLVDAPCSGLGTLREHPEIRWRRSPQDIEKLAARQRSILAAAAGHVRPGGRLVYSTCTLIAAENDAVVDAFLAEHDDFHEVDAAEIDPAVRPLLDGKRLRTFPHRHDMSGFFAACLRRSAA